MAKKQNKTGGRAATTGHIAGDYALSVGMPPTAAPSGWKWTLLTDVARLETGHTPSRKFPEYWDGDVPWIGIRDATGNHGQTIHETNQYTTDLGIENSSARILPANTVCLSRTASVGYVIVMGKPMATSQDFVNWVCSDDLDYRFLMYVLLAEKRSFLRFAHGTTHQTIYFPEVKAFHICLPPIEEQRAIASILGALDDKIELNRRMNATLESLARAIFKSWFVDFDPVHANAIRQNAGKTGAGQMPASSAIPTTHDPKVLDLFPSTFQDSELGPIPEGWGVGTLDDCCEFQEGYVNPSQRKPEYFGDEIKWLRAVDLNNSFVFETTRRLSREGFDSAGKSALLFEPDTLAISKSGTIGRIGILKDYMCGNRAVINIKPKRDVCGVQFVFETLRVYKQQIVELATGSVQKNLYTSVLGSQKIVLPTPEVISAFEQATCDLTEFGAAILLESHRLSALRDTLLPQLLSGKLPIPEALTVTEEALA